MKTTTTHQKTGTISWLSYSGMATAFLAVAPAAKAQVVSVDIDPDAVVDGSTYDVDFDADGTVDLQISQSTINAISVVGVNVPTGNAVLGSVAYNYMYPSVLGSGDPIAPGDPNLRTQAFGSLAYGFSIGNWGGQTGYLGCRFVAGDGMDHYGWIQVNVPSEESALVMAYGYESTPETAIAAGAMGSVGIATITAQPQWGVVANPVSDRAVIKLPAGSDEAMAISLLNPTGDLLFTDHVQGQNTYDLPMATYAPGVYFLRIQQGDRSGVRKVVKQ